MARMKIKELALRIKAVQEKSQKTIIEVKQKREKAKKKNIPNFGITLQTKKNVVNTNSVRDWFSDGIERNWGNEVTNPFENKEWKTRGKEGALAKKLLSKYGAEMTKKGVDYLCDNWQIICDNSGGKLTGLPTVGLLWAMRDRIFSDIERGIAPQPAKTKRHMSGEFIGHGDMPKIGW